MAAAGRNGSATTRNRRAAALPVSQTGRNRPQTREAVAAGLLPLRGPDLQLAEQRGGGGRDGVDRLAERLGVVPGGGAETADLPHVLQRGGADIVMGHLFGVGRAKGLDAPAHSYDRTQGSGGMGPPGAGGLGGVPRGDGVTPARAVPPGLR